MSRRAQAALGMAIAAAFAASAWPVLLGAPEQEAAAVPARVAGPQAGATAPGPAIAHVINTGGLESVGVIDGRGRGFELLRRPAGDPAWSPDGASLAVAEGRNEELDIAVLRFDGSQARKVTSGDGADRAPDFSPDGRRIAFSRAVKSRDGRLRAAIHVVALDGSGLEALSKGRAIDSAPDWSPDGRRIAFTRVVTTRRGFSSPSIMLHDLERGTTRRLVGGADPAFSPDGRRIAYVSHRDGTGRTCFHDCSSSGEIHVIGRDGRADVRLTRSRADDREPAWAGDSEQLLFSSDRSDPARHDYELYAMTSRGRCVTRLTNSSSWSGRPSVRPGARLRSPCRGDGVAAGARTPRVHVDLAELRRVEDYTVFWLGRAHRGLLLNHAARSTGGFDDSAGLVYDDCGRIDRPCPSGVQVQTRSLCWHVEGPATVRLRRIGSERGAPVHGPARDGWEEVWREVHTGDAAVRVIAGTRADAAAALRRLRPLDGRIAPLAPPARRCG